MDKNEFLLSIIIPIYNASKYIKRCVDSIINIEESGIEIILIDDGSDDNSFNIAIEYSKKNKNIKAYHQENHGVSSARNYGIKEANGKFIMFVDSDDFLEKNSLSKILELLNKKECDLILFPYYKGNDIYGYKKYSYELFESNSEQKIEDIYRLTINQKINEPWKKIYISKIIKDNKIQFNEDMFMGEDLCFFIDYLNFVNRVYYYDFPLYYYFKNEEGLTSNIKLSFFSQELKVFNKLSSFIEIKKIEVDYKEKNEILFLHKITRYIAHLKCINISNKQILNELENLNINNIIAQINYNNKFDQIRKFLLLNGFYRLIQIILLLFKGR